MRYTYCRRPSDVYDTDRRTKLTALATISRWLLIKKLKNRSLSHLLPHLGATYAIHLWLAGKPVVDFIFIVGLIELFSLSPTVETLWAEIGRSRRFSKGVGHFERSFHREGSIAHQPVLVSEKYSDCSFVWLQNIHIALFSFVTKQASDGRCITCGRTVKLSKVLVSSYFFTFSVTDNWNVAARASLILLSSTTRARYAAWMCIALRDVASHQPHLHFYIPRI